MTESYTVFRTPYAGWFKLDVATGSVEKVEKNDPFVFEALKQDVAVLLGSDVGKTNAANIAEIERLTAALFASIEERSIAERNLGARTAELGQIRVKLETAEAALLEATSMPKADPAEIERLKQEIARITMERNDAVNSKEKAEAAISGNANPADLENLRKEKDDRIAELEKSLREAQNASSAATREEVFYERWYKERPGWTLGGGGVVAVLLLLFLYSGIKSWTWGYRTDASTTVTKVETPADYVALKAQLSDIAAKQIAEDDAKKAFAEKFKNRKQVPLLPFDGEPK